MGRNLHRMERKNTNEDYFVFWLFRYKTFSATPSTTPSKEYMAMGNLLAQTPLRRKDGTIDDEDYYSESDEIVYCGEESVDLVSILTLGDIDGLRVTTDKCGRVPGTKRKVTTLNPRYTTPVCLQNQIRCISKHVGKKVLFVGGFVAWNEYSHLLHFGCPRVVYFDQLLGAARTQ